MTTYPVGRLYDDAGLVLDAPVVVIASLTTKAGVAITSNGAVVNGSGTATPISVDYDAEAKGEAWITLAVSQATKTVTGKNASIVFYANRERGRVDLLTALLTNADILEDPQSLNARIKAYSPGLTHIVDNLLVEIVLTRDSVNDLWSMDNTP